MIIRTPVDLGALIRDRRKRLGMDQATLARTVGTSRKWLIEVEKGKPTAQIGLILRTLQALEITLTDGHEAAKTSANPEADQIDINHILDSLRPPK
ncbi:MAG TPA: helix-turn-helix domain-containing protein [Acidobacteriaceae bacterium]|jgi:HTH-type transcriptional regulator/antitoxin HipB|nr:helix-turn-helix domain-containing protein [Acidobacteriaceae bacterium]